MGSDFGSFWVQILGSFWGYLGSDSDVSGLRFGDICGQILGSDLGVFWVHLWGFWGQIWGYLGSDSDVSGFRFGDIWGQTLGSDLGVFWGRLWGFWGQIWGYLGSHSDVSGFRFGYIWGQTSGSDFRSFWGQILGSPWGHSGSDLGSGFGFRFGVLWGPFVGSVGGLTLRGSRRGSPLPLGQRGAFGVLQEVVEEQHLFAHLGDLLAVLIEDVLPHELGALRGHHGGVGVAP